MQTQELNRIEPERTTVGELVAWNYHAAGIFRKYGVDFCCGGGVTVRKACEKRGIEESELIGELNRIQELSFSENENYNAWQPDALIEHIQNTHHRFVRLKTDEIGHYAAKVARVHGQNHPENREIWSLFVELANELLTHLKEEEETVFPAIQKLYYGRLNRQSTEQAEVIVKEAIGEMESDHERAGSIMAIIREKSHQYTPPADACTTYRILYQNLKDFEEDLHKHVHLENNILFEKAKALLA